MPGSFGRPVWANRTSRKSWVTNSWPSQVWSSGIARAWARWTFGLSGSRSAVDGADEIIRRELAPYIITTEEKELEDVIVQLLKANAATLATAESCTGGLLANRVTDVPGSSAVFLEGNVTYSNEAKTRTLGVSAELISAAGAVSEEVARAMAEGASATKWDDVRPLNYRNRRTRWGHSPKAGWNRVYRTGEPRRRHSGREVVFSHGSRHL